MNQNISPVILWITNNFKEDKYTNIGTELEKYQEFAS